MIAAILAEERFKGSRAAKVAVRAPLQIVPYVFIHELPVYPPLRFVACHTEFKKAVMEDGKVTERKLTIKEFWDQHGASYPRLQKVAMAILCIPASSASSERVFSNAGFVVNDKRTRLDPSTVNALQRISAACKVIPNFFDDDYLEELRAAKRAREAVARP